MAFNELYKAVNNNKGHYSLFSFFYEKLLEELANNAKKFDAKGPKVTKEMFNKYLVLGLDLNRVCYNSCKNCCYSQTGESLDFELVKPLIKKADILDLTGGEALLYPGLKDLLKNFSEKENRGTVFAITSGLNPVVEKSVKEMYYGNLEELIKSSKDMKYLMITFSYFGGNNLNQRTNDFFANLIKFIKKHNAFKALPIARIVGKKDEIEPKKEEFYKILEQRGNSRELIDEFLFDFETSEELKLEGNNFNQSMLCQAVNGFYVDVKGNVVPCCSIHSSMKPLPPIAHISEPFETIIDKRKIYLGLIKFFSKDFVHCSDCVNTMPIIISKLSNNPEILKKLINQSN